MWCHWSSLPPQTLYLSFWQLPSDTFLAFRILIVLSFFVFINQQPGSNQNSLSHYEWFREQQQSVTYPSTRYCFAVYGTSSDGRSPISESIGCIDTRSTTLCWSGSMENGPTTSDRVLSSSTKDDDDDIVIDAVVGGTVRWPLPVERRGVKTKKTTNMHSLLYRTTYRVIYAYIIIDRERFYFFKIKIQKKLHFTVETHY